MKSALITELEHEIQQTMANYGTTATDRHIIAWDGYLAGLYMHNVLALAEYAYLSALLPTIEDNPVIDLFMGFNRP